MHRWDIINYLIEKYSYKNYLEIGLDTGVCFQKISIENKESVDPALGRYSSANPTHRMTSDDFFNQNTKQFDIIFIDGLHHSDQVDRDIENSLSALTENGIVLVHDVNPLTEYSQKVPRPATSTPEQMPYGWSGDVWKSIVKLQALNKKYTCFTLKTFNEPGISIIYKKNSTRNIVLPEILEYEWFNSNRDYLLNIIEDINLIEVI